MTPPLPGRVVGTRTAVHYTPVCHVAGGGEADVWTARGPGRVLVALKVYEPGRATSARRAVVEALANAARKIPGSAAPIEAVTDFATGEFVGYVMPFFPGAATLQSLLDARATAALPDRTKALLCLSYVRAIG